MAAFHFTAKIHSRAKGASAVRAAAYRAAARLEDKRAGRHEDYTRKADVVATAILLPEGAPAWMANREELWNAVEAREKRRDAQLGQELEVSLPRELSQAENWQLIQDFARAHLVAHGRLCDIAMHVGTASDGEAHPHAHILMPLRQIEDGQLTAKHPDCDWRRFLDRRDRLEELRETWCEFARTRAAELGIELGAAWDHRSFADRGLDLEGQPKLGATAQRLEGEGTPTERTAAHLASQRANGARLMARPQIVLEALTQRQSTFTEAELARWVHRHSADEQFASIMDRCRGQAVRVGIDDQGRDRFSTAELIALEQRMIREAGELAGDCRHQVNSRATERNLQASSLSAEQRAAVRHLVESGDLACLVGWAGTGKSTMLAEARKSWEAAGYRVRGATLSGIAADGLQENSGIETRTLKSLAYAWERERDQLTAKDVLVIDEAGMVGSRELARLITQAGDAGAKIVLTGDPEQLQAIEAGAAFRAIVEHTGAAELTQIRRQSEAWMREATAEFATGRTAAGLARYQAAGAIRAAETDAEATAQLLAAWQAGRGASPDKSRLMLAHTRADVQRLNEAARAVLAAEGALGASIEITADRGQREFAAGDRLLFLKNDRGLEVRNGTIGTVTALERGRITVRTDDGRAVSFDPSIYKDIDHGYAATIHKSQGATIDEAYVLATRGFDRQLAYVSMSRHRERLTIVHSREAFAGDEELAKILGRNRGKDTTLDYPAERLGTAPKALEPPTPRPSAEFMKAHEPEPTRPTSAAALMEEARRRAAARSASRWRERGDRGREP